LLVPVVAGAMSLEPDALPGAVSEVSGMSRALANHLLLQNVSAKTNMLSW